MVKRDSTMTSITPHTRGNFMLIPPCQIRANRSETALTATAIEEADIRSAEAWGACATSTGSDFMSTTPADWMAHVVPSSDRDTDIHLRKGRRLEGAHVVEISNQFGLRR